MPFKALTYDKSEHILTLILSHPPSNAIDLTLAQEIREAVAEASSDDDVWVVLLRGEGNAFSSGSALNKRELKKLGASISNLRVSGALVSLKKPIVAAINGDALGQGLELALACDIRMASSRAKLGLPQVKNGMIPWDGGTQLLPRIIGKAAATELILTSRVITAREARQMGLVSKVVAPGGLMTEAQALVEKLASVGPIAARYTKEAVLKGSEMPLQQGMSLEADLSFLLHTTKDRADGIRSFLGKRQPSFKGE